MRPAPYAPYQPHSITSLAAADRLSDATTKLKQVSAFISQRGSDGATDEEIQHALYMNPSTQRPRRVGLVDDGSVRDSGRTRKTRSGRQAVVWVSVLWS
jgi:hypothetical protein